MTRDSKLWWLAIAGAVLTGITGHFSLLHDAFPGLPVWVDAQVEFWAYMIGILAGLMRMSPLPISPEGRTDMIRKSAVKADTASVAATVAAVKAGEAVQATAIASDAAALASDASRDAAGVP